MFVKTVYGSALNATNGLIESNWLTVPARTRPPSAFACCGAAEADGTAAASARMPRAVRQSSLRAVMRSPAIRVGAGGGLPPERGGYALRAR